MERYADALVSVDDSRQELTKDLERRTIWNGRPVRSQCFGRTGLATPAEAKRRCASISRQLRMLRAHGLIKKVPHTHRYLLTDHGRVALTALSAAQSATVAQLSRAA